MKETLFFTAKALLGADEVGVPKTQFTYGSITSIINLVHMIAGIIAVVVVIIAGMQYALSVGDPGKAAKAKNTIIYALAGLAIVAFSFTIVNLILEVVQG